MDAGAFALNVLAKGLQAVGFTFFKPAERQGDQIAGDTVRTRETGSPLLESAVATIECMLIDTLERADHSLMVGAVVAASVAQLPEGRPDDVTLVLKDLDEKIFYGG